MNNLGLTRLRNRLSLTTNEPLLEGASEEIVVEEPKPVDNDETEGYSVIFEQARAYIVKEFSNYNNLSDESRKPVIRTELRKFLASNHRNQTVNMDKLIERLIADITGYSVLEELLDDEDVEEININAYNDIEVISRTQGWYKHKRGFESPEHARNIISKLVGESSKLLNESTPLIDGYLRPGVRVAAAVPPIIDVKVGVVASIRKQQKTSFTKQMLVTGDTIDADAYDLLKICISNGISIAIAGGTGSGKTATAEALLADIAKEGQKRIFTLEEDNREFDLIRQTDDGVVSRVVHTITRNHKTEDRSIDPQDLLRFALRMHPDIIVPAEMRGSEAMNAQEAARTGHAVVTTLHAKGAQPAYTRILTLCFMEPTNLSEDMLMSMLIEAFPITVFMKQLPDGSRKVMQIFEAESYSDKKVKGRTLFEFVVTDRESEEGVLTSLVGVHKKSRPISDRLAYELLSNGVSESEIKRFTRKDWTVFLDDKLGTEE